MSPLTIQELSDNVKISTAHSKTTPSSNPARQTSIRFCIIPSAGALKKATVQPYLLLFQKQPPRTTVMADPRIVRLCEKYVRDLKNNPDLDPRSPTFKLSNYEIITRLVKDMKCAAVLGIPEITPPSPVPVVPPPKAPVIPDVITGPGVCSVYLAKIAAITKSLQPGERTSDDYNFYYSVILENRCRPLPRGPTISGANLAKISDSTDCSFNRRAIYAVDPNGERYREIYQVLVERKCRDLPPAPPKPSNAGPPSPATSLACEVFFKELVGNPDPKSQAYRELYNDLVTNSCSPLLAPPQ